ncbi:hypothetical protein Tco_1205102, partial [Tanacetum coccineum]
MGNRAHPLKDSEDSDSSRVGIFSMVDVLGDEDYSWRKEGADSE